MEQCFVQEPLPLGLGHLSTGSSHEAALRARASPTGTQPPFSSLFPWINTSCKSLSHWDSATFQLAPPMEQLFAQGPLVLGLGHLAACASHGETLRTRASPTGTRPPCSLLFPWSKASLNRLSHWDLATLHLEVLRPITCHRTWHTMKNKARRLHKCSSEPCGT
ncbi:hypothetical protein Adt_44802 [Abeliophyllum distichum]|uniref:Uncharacterized protein n=1 Tax=Abeliophyllum distichum TaxID=126358 RepID=A0ABD1PBY4_9LAMI